MSSYEPIPVAAKRMLGRMALDLREALLVGNPAPVVTAMYQRSKRVEPGDWVCELSTLRRLLRSPEANSLWDGQFTRYLRSEYVTEPCCGCDRDDGQCRCECETWTYEVHVCENPDGSEFRWENADLVAVPLERSLAEELTR